MKLNENDVKYIDSMLEQYKSTTELTNKLVISNAFISYFIYLRSDNNGKN